MKNNRPTYLKRNMILMTAVLFLCCSAGCSREKEAWLTLESETAEAMPDRQEDPAEAAESGVPEEAPTEEKAAEAAAPEKEAGASIYVDLEGAVNHPGVYEMAEGDRVFQAVESAGGFAADAWRDGINQARLLTDGELIRVLTLEEHREAGAAAEPEMAGAAVAEAQQGSAAQAGPVDLNTADLAALMSLPGIGETRAKAILAYREQTGGFHSTEELMEVEGIKEGIYQKLRDQVVVK